MADATVHGRPLTPGRVARAIRARLWERLQPLNAYRGVYASFADAERAAPRIKPVGYDAARSDGWYLEKMRSFQLEDYPVVYWLREAFRDSRSVLEIGGHVGVAYYGFAAVLEYPPDLQWTIIDVPSVIAAGRALAVERGAAGLAFVDDISRAARADILLAAGSLQYLDTATLAQTVQRLPAPPAHVLLNVTPVYDGPGFITLQNIGTAYCPYRVFNRAELIEGMRAGGYELVDSWRKPRPFRVPGHRDKTFDGFSGFYFRRS